MTSAEPRDLTAVRVDWPRGPEDIGAVRGALPGSVPLSGVRSLVGRLRATRHDSVMVALRECAYSRLEQDASDATFERCLPYGFGHCRRRAGPPRHCTIASPTRVRPELMIPLRALHHIFHSVNDTRPEAAAVVREATANTSPAERIRQVLELSEQVRALSLISLRARFPEQSTLQLVELLVGETLIPVTPRRGESPQ